MISRVRAHVHTECVLLLLLR